MPIGRPYKLASRSYKEENTQIKIKDLIIGGKELALIAGPDSAETRDQTLETAEAVVAAELERRYSKDQILEYYISRVR